MLMSDTLVVRTFAGRRHFQLRHGDTPRERFDERLGETLDEMKVPEGLGLSQAISVYESLERTSQWLGKH